jgi:hypothetical protein
VSTARHRGLLLKDHLNIGKTVARGTQPAARHRRRADLLARLGVRHVNLEPDVLQPVLPDPRELAARVLELRGLANAQGLELLGCWGRAVRALATVREGAALPPPADYALLIVDALGHVVPWEYNGVADLGPVSDLPAVLASAAYRKHVESRSPGTIPECVGCEVEGLCQGNASTTLIFERATGRAGLFEHRCELIRALTRGVLATARAFDPPRRRRASVPPPRRRRHAAIA